MVITALEQAPCEPKNSVLTSYKKELEWNLHKVLKATVICTSNHHKPDMYHDDHNNHDDHNHGDHGDNGNYGKSQNSVLTSYVKGVCCISQF